MFWDLFKKKDESKQTKVCPYCKASIDKNSEYCRYCGKKTILETGVMFCMDGEVRDFRGRAFDMPGSGYVANNEQVGLLLQKNSFPSLPYPSDIYNIKTRERYYESEYYKCTGYKYADIAEDKGRYGEYCIEEYMKATYQKFTFPYPYRILFNLIIPEPNNLFQEIDCVIIIGSFLFVIENKNRSGNITITNMLSKDWVQKIGKEEHSIYNPVLQNLQHIVALERHMCDKYQINDLFYYNVVTLANEAVVEVENSLYSESIKTPLMSVSHIKNLAGNIIKIIEEYEKLDNVYGTPIDEFLSVKKMEKIYAILKKYSYLTEDARNIYMQERELRSEEANKWKNFKYGYWYNEVKLEGMLIRSNGVYLNYLSRLDEMNWRSINQEMINENELIWFDDRHPMDIVDALESIEREIKYIPKESTSIFETEEEREYRFQKNKLEFLVNEKGYVLYDAKNCEYPISLEEAMTLYVENKNSFIPFIAINYKENIYKPIGINKNKFEMGIDIPAEVYTFCKIAQDRNYYYALDKLGMRCYLDEEETQEISVEECYTLIESNDFEKIVLTSNWGELTFAPQNYTDEKLNFMRQFVDGTFINLNNISPEGESALFDKYFLGSNIKRLLKLNYQVYDVEGNILQEETILDLLNQYYKGNKITIRVVYPSQKQLVKTYNLMDNTTSRKQNIKKEIEVLVEDGFSLYDVSNEVISVDKLIDSLSEEEIKGFYALNIEKREAYSFYVENLSLHDEKDALTEILLMYALIQDPNRSYLLDELKDYEFMVIVDGEKTDMSGLYDMLIEKKGACETFIRSNHMLAYPLPSWIAKMYANEMNEDWIYVVFPNIRQLAKMGYKCYIDDNCDISYVENNVHNASEVKVVDFNGKELWFERN